jgi:hypothetical protein
LFFLGVGVIAYSDPTRSEEEQAVKTLVAVIITAVIVVGGAHV